MSETTGMISANPLNQSKNMSMGKILPLYKYKILNFDGQTSKTYENGELLIQGESGITFMKGYINDSKSTNSTIVNNFLHTGDIVYEDDEGYIFFVDRVNDVIKRSGENISTIEIENIIINHPDVRDVSVVGIPDKIMDYKIIAYIILNNTNIDLNNLKDFCKMNLVSYKVPEQFIIVDKFPTTPVGKIQKYKLKKEQQ
jgi:crotonobetaine/carnitine-CoA ligase